MIVVSSGLPKSASTITFSYTKELMALSGKRNGQNALERFYNEGYVHRIGISNFFILLFIRLFKGSFVLKTHSGPDFFIRLLIGMGLAKATYSTRDPRDMILSAIDHGKRTDEKPFINFRSVHDTLPHFKLQCEKWKRWRNYENVLFLSYEDMINDTTHSIMRIASYIGVSATRHDCENVFMKFERNKKENKNFNKGTTGRYLNEMSTEEKQFCARELKETILGLGYPL